VNMSKRFATLMLAAAASVLAVPGSTATPATPAPQVHISNFRFGPQALTVPAGTTVTFVNNDEEPHNVTASDRSYRSPILNTGGRFTHTYATPGEYLYFCALHPHMTGRITVVRR
jgi:plastocyanin